MKLSAVVLVLAVAGCVAPAAERDDPPASGAAVLACPAPRAAAPFEHPAILEASGVARSLREDCLFWVHGDSGAPPVLYAVDGAGRHVGEAWLDAPAVDWEDVASFALDGLAYLLVADVGNNGATRDAVAFYVVPEPALLGRNANVTVRDVTTILVRYPAAPFDVEAVAVDAERDEILLVSKGETRLSGFADPSGPNQALYAARLSAALRAGEVTLEFRGAIPGIRPGPGDPTREFGFGAGGGRVTAMDLSPDRKEVALLTYREVLVWERAADATWAEALRGVPRAVAVPDPGKDQMEGLAFAHDGAHLLVADERGAENSELTIVAAR